MKIKIRLFKLTVRGGSIRCQDSMIPFSLFYLYGGPRKLIIYMHKKKIENEQKEQKNIYNLFIKQKREKEKKTRTSWQSKIVEEQGESRNRKAEQFDIVISF